MNILQIARGIPDTPVSTFGLKETPAEMRVRDQNV